jgi:hypothetical protein
LRRYLITLRHGLLHSGPVPHRTARPLLAAIAPLLTTLIVNTPILDKGILVTTFLSLIHLYIFLNICEIIKRVTHYGTEGIINKEPSMQKLYVCLCKKLKYFLQI